MGLSLQRSVKKTMTAATRNNWAEHRPIRGSVLHSPVGRRRKGVRHPVGRMCFVSADAIMRTREDRNGFSVLRLTHVADETRRG